MNRNPEPSRQYTGGDVAIPAGVDKLGLDYLDDIHVALTDLYCGAARVRGDLTEEPIMGSPAGYEFSGSTRKESLGTARSVAAILLESGGQYLTLFLKSAYTPAEPIACCACIRSLLESCALASWILDPSIDGTDRLRRLLAYRREGLNQQLGFAQAAGQPEDAIREIKERIEQLNIDASKLGAPKGKARNRGRKAGSVKMPESTHLVQKMLDKGDAYRILSAVVHGHSWAIQQLGFTVELTPPGRLTIDSIYVARMRKTLKLKVVAWLALTAAEAFCIPVWQQFIYEGWDKKPLQELFDASFDRLRVTESRRFWH